jgi:hypothetical protein
MIDYSIIYNRKGNGDSSLQPKVYADASHTDCPDTAKSSHGYVVVMGGGPVSWSSRWQSVVALSTTESEYIALVHESSAKPYST